MAHSSCQSVNFHAGSACEKGAGDLQDPEPDLHQPGQFDLESQSRIMDFLGKYPPCSCEYNFVNLFCWQQIYRYSWFIHEERLVICDGASQSLFMPVGEDMSAKALYALSCQVKDAGMSGNIGLVPETYVALNEDLEHYFTVTPDRAAADYVYLTRDLFELKGNKLHKKKNLVSQFKRKYPDYKISAITADNCMAVMKFEKQLLEAMTSVPVALIEESKAIAAAFSNWDALGLEGLILRVDDRIAAFSVHSPLSPGMWNVHFEKSDFDFKGAAQMINRETARSLMGRAAMINREQDLGIPGLVQAKMSYDPHILIRSFFLKPKG